MSAISESGWIGEVISNIDKHEPVTGYTGECDFLPSDVADVIASDVWDWPDGERSYNEQSGCAVLRLNDGRFVFLFASCDSTGWDCQCWGDAVVSDSLERLMQFGVDDDSRARLINEVAVYVNSSNRKETK